jgi:hypothetical protein
MTTYSAITKYSETRVLVYVWEETLKATVATMLSMGIISTITPEEALSFKLKRRDKFVEMP